jgi:tetratricopeptide (TPR) repeat protein
LPALDYYQQAIDHHQRDKDRAISWDGFGDAQSALGNYDEAISAYRWAGVLFPTYAPSWHGLGNAYRALQRDSDAIEAYQKAISLDPNHAWSYHNLGLIGRFFQRHPSVPASPRPACG